MNQNNEKYDLEERTAEFGEDIIELCKKIKQNPISIRIISQLIGSGTSVGANYMEANGASSPRDFKNKIFICKKESQETKHWLRMILRCALEEKEEIERLLKEAQELTLIFNRIMTSMTINENLKFKNSMKIEN